MLKSLASHGFPPLFDEHSTILILGSFPSVSSRESSFFYMHPRNRFWPVLAKVYQEETPIGVEERKSFCLRHELALYDAIESCAIHGSSDASISDVVPADLSPIYEETKIQKILLNGKTAERYFKLYQKDTHGLPIFTLPSTSAANAAWSLDRLAEAWRQALLI